MEIRIEKPPIWEACNKQFKLVQGTVFTYGNILYNPDGIEIPDDLLVHEKCHQNQHALFLGGPAMWWEKYLADPAFRLDQEIRAYAAQYRFICAKYKDRNLQDKYLRFMSRVVSSPLYGCDITEFGAKEAIKRGCLT